MGKGPEKRGGILKPQGSLEKSREEREKQEISKDDGEFSKAAVLASKVDAVKLKRVRQNVALQSIFKKMEESKQVCIIRDDVILLIRKSSYSKIDCQN